MAIYPNRPFLGHRPIDSEVHTRVVDIVIASLSVNRCLTIHRPFPGSVPQQGNAAPYVFQSYEEVARRIDNLASGTRSCFGDA